MVLRPPRRKRKINDTSRGEPPFSDAAACRASISGSDRLSPKTPAVPRRRKSRRARPSQKVDLLIVRSPASRHSPPAPVLRGEGGRFGSVVEHEFQRVHQPPAQVFHRVP